MADTLLFVFDAFDPKEGEVPPYPSGALVRVINRARAITDQRTVEELRDALESLDWMLAEAEGIAPKDGNLTEEDILKGAMQTYDIAGQPAFPEATWAEYFAVLALARVGQIARVRRGPIFASTLEEREKDRWYLECTHAHVIQAMEAVCFAEHLVTQDRLRQMNEIEIETASQEIIRVRNRKAAIAGHAATEALKAAFFEFYLSREFPTYTEAARDYYQSLPEGKKRLLTPTNAINTLSRALSRHLRSNQLLE